MRCAFLGCLPPLNSSDFDPQFLLSDFKSCEIDTQFCENPENFVLPTSVVIVNETTASRTILHHRSNSSREYSFDKFAQINFEKFSWFHFEGRPNERDLLLMMKHCRKHAMPCSVELEKTDKTLVSLIPAADVVFVSKEHALMHGFTNHLEAVQAFTPMTIINGIVVCMWGSYGSAAGFHLADSSIITVSCECALPLSGRPIINTLGAGDAFIAAALAYLVKMQTSSLKSEDVKTYLEKLLRFASAVAAEKCASKDGLEKDLCNRIWSQFFP